MQKLDARLVIVALVSLVAGFGTGRLTGGIGLVGDEMNPSQDRLRSAREEGYAAARKEMEDLFVSKGLSYPSRQPVMLLFGIVKSVGGGSFVVEYDSAQFTVFDSGIVTKTVRLAEGGRVHKIVDAQDGQESAPVPSAGADAASGPPGSPPPELTVNAVAQALAQAALADVRVGDYVQIASANDVRRADVITANEVTIHNTSHLPPGTLPDYTNMPFARNISGQSGDPQAPPAP